MRQKVYFYTYEKIKKPTIPAETTMLKSTEKEEESTDPMLISIDDEVILLTQAAKTGDIADIVKWIFLLIAFIWCRSRNISKRKNTEENQKNR